MENNTKAAHKPLVNDDPQDNVSTALNLFYVKDGMTWVRGGGPAPKYEDISLTDYVRTIAKDHNLEMAKDESDEEISFEMAELLLDGTGTVEGIVATLYTAAWAFSELRERLKGYEATQPGDMFECESTDFGWALRKLRRGSSMRRRGWSGKGAFIKLQTPDERSKMTDSYIYIDASDLETDDPAAPRYRVPWMPSQTDMLANDWEVAEMF